MSKFFLTFLTAAIILGGCSGDGNGGFDVKEPLQPQRTKYRTFISDEELKTQKELALIEANKSIALGKIESEAKLKELQLQKEKELALLKEKERLLVIEHRQAMARYALLGGILLAVLLGAALLWYLDKRRKDKLKAYEDNLKKYFHQKELDARTKIAEKILDTVANTELGMDQKAKLIEALHGPVTNEGEGRKPTIETKHPDTNETTIDIEPEENDDETRPQQ